MLRTDVGRLGLIALLGALLAGCTSNGDSKSEAPVPTAPALTRQERPESADPDLPDFTRTGSGLQYKILQEGTGPKPKADDSVLAKYRGWLNDGTEFDSGEVPFPLKGVIPGWTEGMQYVQEGGTIELVIPWKLGYGASGSPPKIPPYATLHFEVTLVKVNP